MCDFNISELEVSNYRKFENKKFKLNSQMNVFAGRNGSGKTALLEAATVVMGAYLAAFKKYVPSRFVHNISPNDVHLKALLSEDDAVLTSGGIPQYPCRVACRVRWDKGTTPIEFQRVLLKADGRTKFDGSNPMQSTVLQWENLIALADHSDENIILPLVLYLSSARLWNENSAQDKNGVYTRTEAYNRCLDKKHGTEMAFNYIKMLQSVAMEENEGRAFPAYEAILNAVNQALQEELAPGEKVIISTRYGNDIVALKTIDGAVVPFGSLSDGYRNVIKIVLDIAARMCILNPYQKGEALKKTPGIVVIDELDLSLHPTWQRRIVGILKKLFPKIQFICATHSPFIIQSLEEGELITLDKPLECEYAGEGIEDIAEDVMGVEMPQYSEKKIKMYEAAAKYYDALKECKSETDLEILRKKLVELEAEYSDNPAYLAFIRQKYTVKEVEVKTNAPSE